MQPHPGLVSVTIRTSIQTVEDTERGEKDLRGLAADGGKLLRDGGSPPACRPGLETSYGGETVSEK